MTDFTPDLFLGHGIFGNDKVNFPADVELAVTQCSLFVVSDTYPLTHAETSAQVKVQRHLSKKIELGGRIAKC